MRCPLCGLKFAPADAKSLCSKCPLSSNCGLSCCPNCGYRIAREPRWLRSLRCWLQSYRLTASNEMLLTALPLGQTAEIVQICSPDETTGRKLLALGLLPGSRVRLLRRFPCYLIELGQAQLALDREMALAIRVRRDREIRKETRSAVRHALAPPDPIAVPQQQSRPHEERPLGPPDPSAP